MKKSKLTIILCVAALVMSILSGCGKSDNAENSENTGGNKRAITIEAFMSEAEAAGLTLGDRTKNGSEEWVSEEKEGCIIGLYIVNGSAEEKFDKEVKVAKSEIELTSEETASGGNYESFGGSNDDEYVFISRVDNTVLECRADKEYEEEMSELINKLGY